ncbi:MAG: hypothetical protein WC322_03315 [Candidatus Paceibacterota bacterium]|jgi:hypothetical protein
MADINHQIDNAVPLMKARASEFDSAGLSPVDELAARYGADVCIRNLAERAIGNLRDFISHENQLVDSLLDAMNLCALALDVMSTNGAFDD